MTRKTAAAGASYLCGLFIGSFFALNVSAALGGALLASAVLVFVIMRPQSGSKMFVTAFVSVSAAVGILYYCLWDVCERIPAEKYDGTQITGTCLITAAEHFSKGAEYTVKLTLSDGRTIRCVMTSFEEGSLYEGDSCVVSGRLSLPDSGGFFDERDHYGSEGIFLKLDDPEITHVSIKENNIFRQRESLIRRVSHAVRTAVSGDAGEMVTGMIFGKSSTDISPGTQRAMKRAGIMHVLSVSGMHMSVAAAFAVWLLSNGSKWVRFFAAMAAAVIYGVFAGFTLPVIRSIIMLAFVYSAPLLRRRSDPFTSVMAAAVGITLFRPFCITDVSFLLTVSGVLGSAVLTPAVNEYIARHIERKKGIDPEGRRPDLTPIIAPFCAAIAVFPVSALCFDEISVISPLTNLIVMPMCEAATVIAVLGALLYILPFFTVIPRLLFKLSGVICSLVMKLCFFAADIPAAAIPADMPVIKPMLIITLVAMAAAFILLRENVSRAVVFSASVLICAVSAAVYWTAPMADGQMTVLTEGKGCIILMYNGRNTEILDFCGTERGARAAVSYIRRKGTGQPDAAVMLCGEKGADIYSQEFPLSEIILPDDNGLTYWGKNNIIGIGDCVLRAEDGFAVISAGGADIICINKKCTTPHNAYDLAVYNCRADVNVGADMYAVTRRSFKGSVSAGKSCAVCSTAEYIICDGDIYPKEETTWLR